MNLQGKSDFKYVATKIATQFPHYPLEYYNDDTCVKITFKCGLVVNWENQDYFNGLTRAAVSYSPDLNNRRRNFKLTSIT